MGWGRSLRKPAGGHAVTVRVRARQRVLGPWEGTQRDFKGQLLRRLAGVSRNRKGEKGFLSRGNSMGEGVEN